MTSGKHDRRLRTNGDYLCLIDAASLVGTRIVDDWQDRHLAALDATEVVGPARDSVERVRQHLTRILSGGVVQAFGQDHEGAFHEIGRERLSNPVFDINIRDSLFQWAQGDWAPIFVNKPNLRRYLAEISDMKPRQSQTYRWQDIANTAWKLALDEPRLRETKRLIGAVQDAFIVQYDGKPEDKELRDLANEIIEFLRDQSPSREVSPHVTSSDTAHASV